MKMMNLRPVTAADLALLRHWDEQPHVIAASPNDDWGWEVELDRSPDWREQLIGELDGRPIGFVQIIDPAREKATTGVTRRTDCARSTYGANRFSDLVFSVQERERRPN